MENEEDLMYKEVNNDLIYLTSCPLFNDGTFVKGLKSFLSKAFKLFNILTLGSKRSRRREEEFK